MNDIIKSTMKIREALNSRTITIKGSIEDWEKEQEELKQRMSKKATVEKLPTNYKGILFSLS